MKIVFVDRATFAEGIRFDTAPLGRCQWEAYAVTAPGELAGRLGDADVALTNKVRLDAATIRALPRLKLICATATGVDNIDTACARERGIAVTNVRGYATQTVPEHVFGLVLALRRQLLAYRDAARDGRWSASPMFCLQDFPIRDLAGSTLGIVGGGSLGAAVARMAEALGMRVLFAERRGAAVVRPGRAPFEQVLAESDVVSLHLPLTPDTRHLVGEGEFARMKRGAILINTARGALVDPGALLASLRSSHLGGAGIDVLDTEPPPREHPLLAADLPNLIVTPHVAWASLEAQQRLADEVMANISAFARGESRNRVV